MKRAVIMSRVSSDEQAKGYSLDVQFEQLTKYCERNDIEVVKHFREDHSAMNFNRPEFQKFLQYANLHKSEIDYLFVTSWDRFSRNMTEAWLNKGVHMLKNLQDYYVNSSVNQKQQLLSSIFPENLFFEENKCRTDRINEVLRLILKTDSELANKKRGQISNKLNLSPLVVPPGDSFAFKGFAVPFAPLLKIQKPLASQAVFFLVF